MYIEQSQMLISALLLLTAFIFLTQSRILSMVQTFAWQSGLLATATVLQGVGNDDRELYLSALTIVLLKVIFIPYVLRYLVNKLNIRHKVAAVAHPFLLLIGAAALVLFCYYLTKNVMAVAMAVMLLGMLMLIVHRKAISHVIGFMSMENGIFFAGLVSTKGMPMMVEIGIAFDVLIAMVLFGVFFFHMRNSIDSLDVDRLNLLREDVE